MVNRGQLVFQADQLIGSRGQLVFLERPADSRQKSVGFLDRSDEG
jgi:hypothetical protein